jgi:hypothetical protein
MSKAAPSFLLVLGLLQMAGDVCILPVLRGIGAATVASPAPKVFSDVRGLETYYSLFFLEWQDQHGQAQSLALTPEVYARLAWSYNRRNVYGAALAYGPLLVTDPRTRPMFQSVLSYALCGDTPLLKELGVDRTTVSGQIHVRLEPLPGTDLRNLPLVLEASCQ